MHITIKTELVETDLSCFASDTAHFCVHLHNICGEASALLYGKEQSF